MIYLAITQAVTIAALVQAHRNIRRLERFAGKVHRALKPAPAMLGDTPEGAAAIARLDAACALLDASKAARQVAS